MGGKRNISRCSVLSRSCSVVCYVEVRHSYRKVITNWHCLGQKWEWLDWWVVCNWGIILLVFVECMLVDEFVLEVRQVLYGVRRRWNSLLFSLLPQRGSVSNVYLHNWKEWVMCQTKYQKYRNNVTRTSVSGTKISKQIKPRETDAAWHEPYSLFTICGDACPLSCVSAEACFTGWPNARGRGDGGS